MTAEELKKTRSSARSSGKAAGKKLAQRAKGRAKGIVNGRNIKNIMVGSSLLAGLDETNLLSVAKQYQGAAEMFVVGLLPGQADMRSASIKVGLAVAEKTYIFPRIKQAIGLTQAAQNGSVTQSYASSGRLTQD